MKMTMTMTRRMRRRMMRRTRRRVMKMMMMMMMTIRSQEKSARAEASRVETKSGSRAMVKVVRERTKERRASKNVGTADGSLILSINTCELSERDTVYTIIGSDFGLDQHFATGSCYDEFTVSL